MSKNSSDVTTAKEVNQAEHKELVGMKDQIQNLRHQIGLLDEQVMELEAQKKQAHAQIQQQKQAFRDRIINIARSYEIELGTIKDGKVWQFDEPNLAFIQRDTQQPKAKPETVVAVAPDTHN
jgi:multidrug resistance efflux pump